jgi:hypothetical protein
MSLMKDELPYYESSLEGVTQAYSMLLLGSHIFHGQNAAITIKFVDDLNTL